MSNRNECPCCGIHTYDFHYGAYEEGHRFGGSEPDEGYCPNCGFVYTEHIKHPESEQVARYKQSDEYKKFIKLQEGK